MSHERAGCAQRSAAIKTNLLCVPFKAYKNVGKPGDTIVIRQYPPRENILNPPFCYEICEWPASCIEARGGLYIYLRGYLRRPHDPDERQL
jgi:hypothetical protein